MMKHFSDAPTSQNPGSCDRRTLLGGMTGLAGSALLGAASGLLPLQEATAASLPATATVPYNGRFYGCMIGADMHGNTFISKNKTVAMRFLAEETGLIKSFNFDLRHDGPPPNNHPNPSQDGYHSDGMGGNVTVSLRRDLGNGQPNMASSGLIAQTQVNNGDKTPLVLRPQYATWSFISAGSVQKGTLYHLVFSNSHPTDFVSINAHFYYQNIGASDPSGRHGPYYRSYWANQYQWKSDPWIDRIRMPFITLNYTNGIATGVGEDGGFDDTLRTVGAAQQARQTFIVMDRSYTFKAIWFRAWSADGVGELVVRLERAGGSAMSEQAVPAKSLAVGDRHNVVVPWKRLAVAAPLKLEQNKSYNLVFYAKKGSFRINAMRDGTTNGFVSRNRWLNSSAQFSQDGGKSWLGWTIPSWNKTGYRKDMRLPAGFELV